MTSTVFITGATGIIGSAVLGELLRTSDAKIVLSVRGSSNADVKDRVRSVLLFLGLDQNDVWARLRLLRADVVQSHLGLPENEYGTLIRSLTHIIHSAGNIKLNQPIEIARRDNVHSLRNVIELAQQCRENGQFRKLDYVSTVEVTGRWKGRVPETQIRGSRVFRNPYEESKAEAEDLLFACMAKGFPATIHRPSMVVGDSFTGKVLRYQVFYYLLEFLLGKRSWGILPHFGDLHLDIIPSDYVARAIVLSVQHPEAVGRVFHLCAGPEQALSVKELAQQARSIAFSQGDHLPTLKFIDPVWIRRLFPMVRMLAPSKMGRALKFVPFLLTFLDEELAVDNHQSVAFFSAYGLSVPSPACFLPKVIGFYLRNHLR